MIEIEKIEIEKIKPNIKNPRKDYNRKELEELKQSLQSIGQTTPCIVDEDLVLLAGHRRYYAAKELGWKELDCDVKKGLSIFEKSSIMISSNATQVQFNAWESRKAIAKIYWEEFLEEYNPRGNNDKGYTIFAKKMGLSLSYIKKIIESTQPKNERIIEEAEKEKLSSNTVDEILTSPIEYRSFLLETAINRKKQRGDMERDIRIREFIRAEKRKIKLSQEKIIGTHKFKIWIGRLEALGNEFCDEIIEKGSKKDLKILQKSIENNILNFYNKLRQYNE
jgi:ParB/RepB/Spo0J family partition protein